MSVRNRGVEEARKKSKGAGSFAEIGPESLGRLLYRNDIGMYQLPMPYRCQLSSWSFIRILGLWKALVAFLDLR